MMSPRAARGSRGSERCDDSADGEAVVGKAGRRAEPLSPPAAAAAAAASPAVGSGASSSAPHGTTFLLRRSACRTSSHATSAPTPSANTAARTMPAHPASLSAEEAAAEAAAGAGGALGVGLDGPRTSETAAGGSVSFTPGTEKPPPAATADEARKLLSSSPTVAVRRNEPTVRTTVARCATDAEAESGTVTRRLTA